ncbi:MAG: hypothetical protein V1736_12325, partial [Pseudomonadota bacterium]
ENALRSLGVLNFYVPGETYGMAETCHAAILHYWVDQMTASTAGISVSDTKSITSPIAKIPKARKIRTRRSA